MSYVDLHLHLLPGVDDGAPDEAAALTHARRLAAEGVRDVTVTPHISPDWPLEIATIPRRVAELAALLAEHAIGVRVRAGGELDARYARGLTDAELELIAQGPAGSRWLLVEAPFRGLDDAFAADCDALLRRGFGVVIAHPERAAGADEPAGAQALRTLLATGAIAQVNVCSLLGNNGLAVQESAVSLLRAGLAYVIASDGHPGTRDHTLALGFVLAQRAGASSVQAWRLTQANPRFLLTHGIPQAPSPATTAALELALD
ncbi:MAG: CpsB/CapC family capsule biosynthesis tyrosine phosphatase [Solirubrobacteraceae bacterium]|jgi:protein-tyrosine phosphatase